MTSITVALLFFLLVFSPHVEANGATNSDTTPSVQDEVVPNASEERSVKEDEETNPPTAAEETNAQLSQGEDASSDKSSGEQEAQNQSDVQPSEENLPAGYNQFRSAGQFSPSATSPNAPDLVPAVFATGGGGRFRDLIEWMQWAHPDDYIDGLPSESIPAPSQRPDGSRPDGLVIGVEGNAEGLPTSRVINTYRDIGDSGRLITTCRASELDFSLTRRGRWGEYLVATIPGNWSGDTLDNLYNIGGSKGLRDGHPATGTVPDEAPNPNRLVIGLGTGQYDLGRGQAGFGATPRFKVECAATFWQRTQSGGYTNPRNLPIDGLVVADAESASYSATSDEWIEVETPASVSWHVLDRLSDPIACPSENREFPSRDIYDYATATFGIFQPAPSGSRRLRLVPNGNECESGLGGPGIVMLARNVSEAIISLQGNGVQAAAVGVVMPIDHGDAPRSYGSASAFFRPLWNQSLFFDGTNLYRSVQESQPLASASFLGESVNHNGPVPYDSLAGRDGDDDGIQSAGDLVIHAEPGGQVSRRFSCTGPGLVAGWIDWNANGVFDAEDKSDEVSCEGDTVDLTWQVPNDVVRAVNGEDGGPDRTFMRVRIADPSETSNGSVSPLQPTGVTSTGEVEDYAVEVYIPMLELKVEIDNSEEWTDTPYPPQTWGLSARQGKAEGATRYLHGQGSVALRPVSTGHFDLRTQGPNGLPVRGYEEDQDGWECTEYPGTVRPPGEFFAAEASGRRRATLHIPGSDRVTCTISYRPRPAELNWNKTDPRGKSLGGSQWRLEGPRVPAGTVIHDCESLVCSSAPGPYVDKNPLKGEFELKQLRWGQHYLTETRAPTGYVMNENPTVVANLTPRAKLGNIINQPRQAPAVPLTGGVSAQMYGILGASVTVGAVLIAAVLARRETKCG